MLIVDKSRDIRTLQSLGASWSVIRLIFFLEGMMISLLGMSIGIVTGLVVVYLQSKFNLVLINGEDAYPVLVKGADILYISLTVLAIGALASWLPASRTLTKRRLSQLGQIDR
jgi:lipoprotein-releasing system permease protein